MEFEFLLNGIFSFLIFTILFFWAIKNYSKSKVLFKNFLIIGLVNFIIFVFSFLWFVNVVNFSNFDFMLIYSFMIFIQGISLFFIVYRLTQEKGLFYLFFFYFLIFLSILFLDISFMKIFIEVYFLFVFLLSLSFLSRKDDYRNISFFQMGYSGFSLLLNLLVVMNIEKLYLMSIFYSILFLGFIVFFLKYLSSSPLPLSKKKKKEKSYFFNFFRSFVFVVALINLIFIGTVVIHEFGHLIVSYLYNCSSRQIVFSGGFPDTQILCSNISNTIYVTLGGIVGPIIVGLILFLVGGSFLKETGALIVGFNLIMASKDYFQIGLSKNISLLLVIIGIIFVAGGIIYMAKSKSEEYLYSTKNVF